MRKNWESARHKARLGRNLATLAALLAFCGLIYAISVIRMTANW